MEIGNEISQKIRSAIKAKLVDLGAYVDDELPDYIMVMVANKKTQAQMTEDLNLFLGNNTERFTAWLHALLTKLKSITTDPKEALQSQESSKEVELPLHETSIKAINEPHENDVLMIRAEDADDFDEEERIDKKPVHSKNQTSASDVAAMKTEIPVKSGNITVTKEKIVKTAVKSSHRKTSDSKSPHEIVPKSVVSLKSKPSSRVPPRSSESSRKASRSGSELSRKRRAPGSVIGSVNIKHYSDDEEEYDPHKPLIGRVASTIKVSERRSSVPPAMQANKSLLMKAVSAAQVSIEKTTKKSQALVRPIQQRLGDRSPGDRRSHSRPYEAPGALQVKGRLGDQNLQLFSRSKREEVMHRLKWQVDGDSESSDKEDVSPEQSDVRTVKCEGTETGEEADVEVEDDEVEEKRTISVHNNPAIVEDDDILATLVESGAEESDFTDDGETEESQPQRIVQEKLPIEGKDRPSSPKFVVTLDGVNPEMLRKEIDFSDEDIRMEEEEEAEVDRERNIVRVKPRIQNTQEIEFDLENDQEYEEDEIESQAKKSKLMERCRFWPACKSGTACEFHHPSVPCRKFPNCTFGEKCLFIHPNCKFDANCTRPACPYTHASKRNSSGPSLPIVIQPVQVLPMAKPAFIANTRPTSRSKNGSGQATCKFFPQCTNMNCPFLHPRPCRYGISCARKATCPFSHPTLPTKDQLVWTPHKHTTSSSAAISPGATT